MRTMLLVIFIVLVVVGGYFLFTQAPPMGSDLAGEITGEVVSVDLEQVTFDGPALITFEDENGEIHIVAVPSMGLPLCEAFENITDPFAIEADDHVSVLGEVDEEGRIVPCSSEEHRLIVTTKISDKDFGYEFTYRKSPNGYVIFGDTESTHEDFVSGHVLFDRREYEILLESTDAREGPPSIHVRVYDNPENLHAPVWAQRNPSESNVGLAFAEPEEAVVGGANATFYIADGLYPIDTFIVASGGYIYVLMGSYLERESAIYEDFHTLVDSFTSIPTFGLRE